MKERGSPTAEGGDPELTRAVGVTEQLAGFARDTNREDTYIGLLGSISVNIVRKVKLACKDQTSQLINLLTIS
jgi:hypothetical protein